VEAQHATFSLVTAAAAGMVAQIAARHLRIPGIVVLLAVGAALGPDLLGWVQPRDLGSGLFAIVDIAVAVILFEGGLNLRISQLRREQAAIRRLVTWGALVTLAGGSAAAHLLLGWGWQQAILFGSLVTVTGPTVVGPLISELRLKTRPATVLEAEGVLIDPIGAILAVLVLSIALEPEAGALAGGQDLATRVGVGLVAGVAAAYALAGLLKAQRILPEEYVNVFVLAAVLLLFQGCEELVSHSGILAVTVAGVVLGNLPAAVDRDLREFKDQLTVLLIGLLFVLLAADVRFAELYDLGWMGLGVVAVLVVVVRPLGVWLCTLGTELSLRERLFIAWVAPRGIVAAAVASLVASALESSGIPGGGEIRAMVFVTVAGTVTLAGLTAAPVAGWLGVRLPGRDTVAILGAGQLGLALARELHSAGTPVVFIDSNPQNCRHVEEAGFVVVYGNALREQTLRRARIERVESVVALTANDTLNGVFVERARTLFGVPRSLVAAGRVDTGLVAEVVERRETNALFEGPHDVERWDGRLRGGEVEIQHWTLGEGESDGESDGESEGDRETFPQPAEVGERFVVLTLRRGESAFPMSAGSTPRPGDVATVAVYLPERERVASMLRERGWEPA